LEGYCVETIGDSADGLTGTEIGQTFKFPNIPDIIPKIQSGEDYIQHF
jgi:hypothetical protein